MGTNMASQADLTTSVSNVMQPRERRLSLQQRRTILGFIIWFLIPAAVSIYLAFQKWNLISPPQYVGLQNIQHLFEDPLLGQSLKATFVYTFLSVPLRSEEHTSELQ